MNPFVNAYVTLSSAVSGQIGALTAIVEDLRQAQGFQYSIERDSIIAALLAQQEYLKSARDEARGAAFSIAMPLEVAA